MHASNRFHRHLLGIMVLLTLACACSKVSISGSAGKSYISLFKCVAAGDYRCVSVLENKTAVSLRFGRDYRIIEFRAGAIQQDEYASLRQLIDGSAFDNLQPEYPLPPPKEGSPPLEYEDVYYLVGRVAADDSKFVLAHEYAAPKSLQSIIEYLVNIRPADENAPPRGTFLIALPSNLLSCLRGDDLAPTVDLSEFPVKEFPPLQKALNLPALLVSVSPGDASRLRQQLFRNAALRRMSGADLDVVLILLE